MNLPSLAFRLSPGTRVVQYEDGVLSVEAGDGGICIETIGDDPEDAPLSAVAACGGCSDRVLVRADAWTLCPCGTQTMGVV